MLKNRYLHSRMQEKRSEMDGRNPYGSRGGYVTSSRSRRDRNFYDEYNYPKYDDEHFGRNSSREYERDYGYHKYAREYPRYNDYESYNYFDRGMNDYASEEEEEYKEDLKKWIKKLKEKDTKYNLPMESVIKLAKDMGVKFKDFTEEEYYATYLMMLSDYPTIANDPHVYLIMAKDFLEDDDIEVTPSEKLCIYFYKIVRGE